MATNTLWQAPTATIPLRARVQIDAISLGSGEGAGHRQPTVADAAVFLAAAAITTGTVVIRNWDTLAGAAAKPLLCDSLASMGAYVVRSAEGLTCTTRSTSGHLEGVSVDLTAFPDLVPALATLAAMADSPSSIRGVAASDSAITMRANLQNLGGLTHVEDDVLEVFPQPLHGGQWTGGGDDHISILGAVIGLMVPGVVLEDVDGNGVGLSRFLATWRAALAADEHILPGTSRGTVPYYD